MRNLLLLLTICLTALAGADRFDDYVTAKMAEQKIPGLAFAVVYKGKVVMSRAYGMADVDKKAPVAKDTAFEIASVSKPFVATAVMMLFEQGKFRLDDSIGKYVPELPLAWSRVPIRNLLSHTSGIPEYRGGPNYARHFKDETPFLDIVKQLPTDLVFDVADHFAYSNTNYLLLGQLIEKLTGKPYTDFLQTQIFDPLAMTSTGFVGKKDHAQGYSARGGGFYPAQDCSLAWAGPGGCIVSTTEDIAKFDAGLRSQKLIKNATLAMMLAPTNTKLGPMDYGFGWQVAKIGNTVMALHSGKMNGSSSMFLRLLDEQISVILLTNANEIDGNTITRGILGLYFPEMDPRELTPIVDDDPETTKIHFAIIRSIVAGKPDMDAFTDDYKAHVPEEKLKAIGAELARGGRIKPLEVVRRYKKGSRDAHEYLMTQGQTKLLVTFIMDADGKVAGLTIGAP